MNYKKFIAVSFAILLANTGTPVIANAITSSPEEAMDEEVLKSIFDSSVDFNSIKTMNEIKKDNVEEEQQEETEYKRERLEDKQTTSEEAVVDNKADETSEEKSNESIPEKETKTEVSKESESITEEEQESDSPVKEVETTTADVQENNMSGESRESEIVGMWGSCQWIFDSSTNQYRILDGTIPDYKTSGVTAVAPWLRPNSVITNDNVKNVSVIFQDGVKFSNLSLFTPQNDVEYDVTAERDSKLKIKSIQFDKVDTSGMTDSQYLFKNGNALKVIKGLENFDTSNLEKMNEMFSGTGIKSLDLSGWDTSNVTSMQYMFANMPMLESLDISGWNLNSVPVMDDMFKETTLAQLRMDDWDLSNPRYKDLEEIKTHIFDQRPTTFGELSAVNWKVPYLITTKNLFSNVYYKKIDIHGWDTPNLQSMDSMFSYNNVVTDINMSNWNISNITDRLGFDFTFSSMNGLKVLDLSGLDVSNVTMSTTMFRNTQNVVDLKVNNWEFGDKTEFSSISPFFMYMDHLTTLEAKEWNVPYLTSATLLFRSAFGPMYEVTTLDISGWNTPRLTIMSNLGATGSGKAIKNLKMSNWDTSKVTTMANMFVGLNNVEVLDISGFNTSKVTTMANMFGGLNNVEVLDISGFNTSNVTDMSRMLQGMSSLKKLDISNFDTSKVTTMANMFDGLKTIDTLDVSKFNTSNVTDMSFMFHEMSNLKTLNVSGFDTSKVTDMKQMFSYMGNLETLDLSNWIIKKDTQITKMMLETKNVAHLVLNDLDLSDHSSLATLYDNIFQYTSLLETLEVKNWDISNITSLDSFYKKVFGAPVNVTKLDLSGWTTQNVIDMTRLFEGANKLESINLSGWTTNNVVSLNRAFAGATELNTLDLSNWNTEDAGMTEMFIEVGNLERLTLGDDFRFNASASLSSPVSSNKESTGCWTREDGNSAAYEPKDFMEKFGTGDLKGGLYVAEVNIPYDLSNFKSETTTIGKSSIISFDLVTNDSLDSSLFTDGILHFSVTAESLPDEIEYESIDVSYVSLANGKLTPIKAKRYDKNNKTIHFDVTEDMLAFTNKIRITLNGTAWNNTTNSKENTTFLVDYNTDETGPVENSYLVRKIAGQVQVNNGNLSFSSVPEQLEFNPTKLVVTNEDMLVDRVIPDWGIQISDYRGTNALSKEDRNAARQDWELLATMNAFQDSKGETVSPSALGLVYINETGSKEEITTAEAVVIWKHKVENETPKENHSTTVSWKEEVGLKTIVKNRNALNSNEEYSAQVNYELRVAP
ncbi:TPA: BspA family leucine-rich repeat surface protein [Enterococcus faecalis]